MKSFRKELSYTTDDRMELINITPDIHDCLQASGIREGICLVNAMCVTASVFINADELGLHQDYRTWLERLAPYDPEGYQHNDGEKINGDAHLKRQIMGREVMVAVTQGEFDFGRWEQIFYGEFDGQRQKHVLVKIIGE